MVGTFVAKHHQNQALDRFLRVDFEIKLVFERGDRKYGCGYRSILGYLGGSLKSTNPPATYLKRVWIEWSRLTHFGVVFLLFGRVFMARDGIVSVFLKDV